MELHVFVRETIDLLEEQIRAAKCSVYISSARGQSAAAGTRFAWARSSPTWSATRSSSARANRWRSRSAAARPAFASSSAITASGWPRGTTSGSSSASNNCSRRRSRVASGLGLWIVAEATHRLKARSACAARRAKARRSSSVPGVREPPGAGVIPSEAAVLEAAEPRDAAVLARRARARAGGRSDSDSARSSPGCRPRCSCRCCRMSAPG